MVDAEYCSYQPYTAADSGSLSLTTHLRVILRCAFLYRLLLVWSMAFWRMRLAAIWPRVCSLNQTIKGWVPFVARPTWSFWRWGWERISRSSGFDFWVRSYCYRRSVLKYSKSAPFFMTGLECCNCCCGGYSCALLAGCVIARTLPL